MTKRMWLSKNKIMEKQDQANLCVDISHKLFPKLIEETFGFQTVNYVSDVLVILFTLFLFAHIVIAAGS